MSRRFLVTVLAWVWVAAALVLYLKQFTTMLPHIARAL